MIESFKKVVICLLFLISIAIAGETFYTPQLPMPEHLYSKFKTYRQVEVHLKAHQKASDYFDSAMYYFFEVININEGKGLRKGKQKRYVDRAIKYFEKASELATGNLVYKAMKGTIYSIKTSFTSFPGLLEWSKKGMNTINKAVESDKYNPEIRFIRLRSFIHFPYQYYPTLKDTIIEDSKLILNWVESYNKLSKKKKLKEFDEFFKDVKNEIYFLLGNYYFSQVNDKKLAENYFQKIDKKNRYYKKYQEVVE